MLFVYVRIIIIFMYCMYRVLKIHDTQRFPVLYEYKEL